ncbi:MAG TPA: Wzz/FepE/Etk N-terminal domain-containing protein [Dermatophilaceae bacterium]|nr:Wzz/FepE/Etk N-terminal domain-containing protein [Dermatophilaceae bacterium]
MEIKDYLLVAKRRLWLLIGIPLLAGAIAAGVIMAAPTQYTAMATVIAPALVGGATGQYTGSQAVTQFVSAFQSTAQGPAVDARVFADTQIEPGAIADGLVVAQIGGSSAVTVTFTTTKKGEAVKVVTAVVQETMKQMFSSQVDLTTAQVEQATKDVKDANAAIDKWGSDNGLVDPERVYQAQLDRLNGLLQNQSSLLAQGNSTAASALGGTISSVRNDLKRYGPLMAAFNDLTATRDSAQSGLVAARQRLADAKQQLGAADPAKVAFVGKERSVDKTSQLLTVGLPVVGAGLFLAILLVLVLEVLRGGRTPEYRPEDFSVDGASRSEMRRSWAVGARS